MAKLRKPALWRALCIALSATELRRSRMRERNIMETLNRRVGVVAALTLLAVSTACVPTKTGGQGDGGPGSARLLVCF